MTHALTCADEVALGLYLPLQYHVEPMAKDRETARLLFGVRVGHVGLPGEFDWRVCALGGRGRSVVG